MPLSVPRGKPGFLSMEGQNYLLLQTFSTPFPRFTELFYHVCKDVMGVEVETPEYEMHSLLSHNDHWLGLAGGCRACYCCQIQQWFRKNSAHGEVEPKLASKYSFTRNTPVSKESQLHRV